MLANNHMLKSLKAQSCHNMHIISLNDGKSLTACSGICPPPEIWPRQPPHSPKMAAQCLRNGKNKVILHIATMGHVLTRTHCTPCSQASSHGTSFKKTLQL